MIKLSCELLTNLKACEAGIYWFTHQKKKSLRPIIGALLADNHAGYARWLISRLLSHPQRILWSIYSVELCLEKFESAFPADDRPRKAIQAAKDFSAGKIDLLSVQLAAESARSAVWSARSSAESLARLAAESAARSAVWSARSAVWSARSSAESAESLAKANKKIMDYGLKLLGE